MIFLVDTSVWSIAFRRPFHRLSPAEAVVVSRLNDLIQEGRVALVGPVRQELLSGIRSKLQFMQLRDALRAFPDENPSTEDFERAAEVTNLCIGNGIAVAAVDILLCAMGSLRSWRILTTDRDFQRYAKVTGVAVEFVNSRA